MRSDFSELKLPHHPENDTAEDRWRENFQHVLRASRSITISREFSSKVGDQKYLDYKTMWLDIATHNRRLRAKNHEARACGLISVYNVVIVRLLIISIFHGSRWQPEAALISLRGSGGAGLILYFIEQIQSPVSSYRYYSNYVDTLLKENFSIHRSASYN